MKKSLNIILLCFVVFSCKYDDYKFYEKIKVSGKAYFFDDLSSEDKIVASKTIVKLCLDKNGDNCILSDTTNNQGEFSFDFKPRNSDSLFIFCDTEFNKIRYKSSQKVLGGMIENISFDIKVEYKNGIKILVNSAVKEEPLKDVDVYFFRNLEMANKAFLEKDPAKINGFEISKKTNKYGVAFYGDINILPNTTPKFHVLLVDVANNRRFVKSELEANKIENKILGKVLEKKVVIFDNLKQESVEGKVKYDLIKSDGGILRSDETTQIGELKAGYFYDGTGTDPLNKIKAKATISNLDYSGEMSPQNDEIRLTSNYKNAIASTLKSNNDIIRGIKVYLYDNLEIAKSDTSIANPKYFIAQTVSNSKGIAVFGNIDIGHYYVVVFDKINKLDFKRISDKIVIGANDIREQRFSF